MEWRRRAPKRRCDAINFSSFASQGVPNQDTGNPFLLNGITFGGEAFTLDGNPLQFEINAGVTPFITQNSNANQTINEGLVLGAGLTINGSGTGTLTLMNPSSQTNGGSPGLTVSGAGAIFLGAANTFTGNTTITSGLITLGNGLALQNSTVEIDVDNGLNFNGQASATIERFLELCGRAVELRQGNIPSTRELKQANSRGRKL